MKRTITTYTCDGCGNTVERPRDLRKFTLVPSGPSGRNRYRDAPAFEVCDSCEEKVLEFLLAFVPEKDKENLVELRREPVAA